MVETKSSGRGRAWGVACVLAGAALASGLVGCKGRQRTTPTPPEPDVVWDFVTEYGYTPMVLARDDFLPGTIYDANKDEVIMFAEDCLLSGEGAPQPRRARAAVAEKEIKRRSTARVQAGMSELFKRFVTASTAQFDLTTNAMDASSVDIRLDGVFVVTMSGQALKSRAKELAASPRPTPCVDAVWNTDYFIIQEAIGATEISITFVDEGGAAIELDASFVALVEAELDAEAVTYDRTSLKFSDPGGIFIGYKAMHASELTQR